MDRKARNHIVARIPYCAPGCIPLSPPREEGAGPGFAALPAGRILVPAEGAPRTGLAFLTLLPPPPGAPRSTFPALHRAAWWTNANILDPQRRGAVLTDKLRRRSKAKNHRPARGGDVEMRCKGPRSRDFRRSSSAAAGRIGQKKARTTAFC